MRRLTLFVIAIVVMVIIVPGFLSVTSAAQTICPALLVSSEHNLTPEARLPLRVHFDKKSPTIKMETPVFNVSNSCADRPTWDINLYRLGSKNKRIYLHYVRTNDKTSYWPSKPLGRGKYVLSMGDADQRAVYYFRR